MAVPKKKTSKMRSRTRRSHYKMVPPGLTRCTTCKSLIASHNACPNCGKYKGREVLVLDEA